MVAGIPPNPNGGLIFLGGFRSDLISRTFQRTGRPKAWDQGLSTAEKDRYQFQLQSSVDLLSQLLEHTQRTRYDG